MVDNTAAVRRYYSKNRESVLAAKTLRKIQMNGRVPRDHTIEKNSMDRDAIKRAMTLFLESHPDKRSEARLRLVN